MDRRIFAGFQTVFKPNPRKTQVPFGAQFDKNKSVDSKIVTHRHRVASVSYTRPAFTGIDGIESYGPDRMLVT